LLRAHACIGRAIDRSVDAFDRIEIHCMMDRVDGLSAPALFDRKRSTPPKKGQQQRDQPR
jgi:hypothetical protein